MTEEEFFKQEFPKIINRPLANPSEQEDEIDD
jgi:hypothetical protein